MSGYIALSYWQLAAASVFVLIDAALSVLFGLRIHRSLLFAAIRMVVQLAHEQGDGLLRDFHVPFDLPRHPVEPPRQGGLEPLGAVGREVRGDRCLHDGRLRYALAGRVIGKPAREVGREPEGMPSAHPGYRPILSAGSSAAWRAMRT